jgi:GTP-binding protein
VVFDAETGDFLTQVTEDCQEVPLLRGGRGGLGNWHFKSATNRTPRYAQPGEPAIEKSVILELKLLADVGLVGFPNAGKSTLLSSVSAARPKIADYPFTTMEPQLGIVSYRDSRSFVMADIPGIIEGASEGKGLGLRFLRHIERNAVLLFMVPADADDITREYEILLKELEHFNPQLMDKPRVLAISKSDMLDDELIAEIEPLLPTDLPHVFISSVTGLGIANLKDELWRAINDENNRIGTADIIHRPLDGQHRVREEDEFIFENAPAPDDDEDFGEDYHNISPDAWGEDADWDDDDMADAEEVDMTEDEDYDDEIIFNEEDAFDYESSLDDEKL